MTSPLEVRREVRGTIVERRLKTSRTGYLDEWVVVEEPGGLKLTGRAPKGIRDVVRLGDEVEMTATVLGGRFSHARGARKV